MRRYFVIFLVGLLPTVAVAEPPKQAGDSAGKQDSSPPPVPSDPQTTSATYGDWVLVCQRAGGADKRQCEVSQSVQVQGQPGPITQLAIFTPGEAAETRIAVVLPANVLLTATPKIGVDESDTQAVDLNWQRCLPGGCFADAQLKGDVLSKWRGSTDRGRLEFKDGAGRTVVLPFSFRGLDPAYGALTKEKK